METPTQEPTASYKAFINDLIDMRDLSTLKLYLERNVWNNSLVHKFVHLFSKASIQIEIEHTNNKPNRIKPHEDYDQAKQYG